MEWLSRILGPPISPINFDDAFDSIEQLKYLTNDLEQLEAEVRANEDQLKQIVDSIDVAVWAKDVDNRFVYANKACCDKILHCSEDDVLKAVDTDFEEDALANICIRSDEITKARGNTCRFIEHSLYPGGDVWIDTEKSPWFRDGEIVGTVGTGKIITEDISEDVRNRFNDPLLIEIPVDSCLVPERIEKLVVSTASH
jgi:PAS domain S-box-containing protein